MVGTNCIANKVSDLLADCKELAYTMQKEHFEDSRSGLMTNLNMNGNFGNNPSLEWTEKTCYILHSLKHTV